jgi:hypothetical protein
MNSDKRQLISNILKKVGLEDPDMQALIELIIEDENKLIDFRESVIDTVCEFHNDKKDMKGVIEELVTVLSAAREYDNDKESYSEKQRMLLWDTGSDTLIKALKILNKS